MPSLPTGTNYPNSIDGLSDGYAAVNVGDTLTATYANCQTSAILAIENVLGAQPLNGTPYSTIGAAIVALASGAGGGGVANSLYMSQSFT
jgi:hypothetical protein